MKFVASEWVPGAKAVFEKFADYVPRQETASWLAGGKNMLVDRIEWVIMPDPATAVGGAAERRGRLVGEPDPRSRAGAQAQPQHQGRYRRSARQHRRLPHEPPASALQQREGAPRGADGARARKTTCAPLVGDDNSLWKPLPGFFTPGTPLYTEAGGEILKGKRDIDGAKKLLAEGGYTGQPVTCVVAQDQPITKAHGRRHGRPAEEASA